MTRSSLVWCGGQSHSLLNKRNGPGPEYWQQGWKQNRQKKKPNLKKQATQLDLTRLTKSRYVHAKHKRNKPERTGEVNEPKSDNNTTELKAGLNDRRGTHGA